VSIEDEDGTMPWQSYGLQPRKCVICGEEFTPRSANAKTCGAQKCKREHDRRYAKAYYDRDPDKNIAQSMASRRRRRKPVFKECIAPHPTKPGALCGNRFEVKPAPGGQPLTCSEDCSVRRRNALQNDRYHANAQAKRDYHNARYATKLKKPVGKARCPNPACGREYDKWRTHQPTCGRSVCHQWQYSQTHQDQINERKRRKRRENPVYAAHDKKYQRNYRAANPDKFKAYQPKINEGQRRRRAAARQAAIAAGTFVDHRRKLTDAQRSKIIKRRKAGETLARIAKSYGVSIPTVSRITDQKRKA
jgi:hypothetical protein